MVLMLDSEILLSTGPKLLGIITQKVTKLQEEGRQFEHFL